MERRVRRERRQRRLALLAVKPGLELRCRPNIRCLYLVGLHFHFHFTGDEPVGRDFERHLFMQFQWSARFCALVSAFAVLSAPQVRAQNVPLSPLNGARNATAAIPEVGDANLNALSLPAFGAVSLRASLAGLQDNPASAEALRRWVGRGNVVFLHTDAAQFFGMQTVAPRAATADAGGQGFGRARAALPFGSHPLLRGSSETSATGHGGDPTRLPGVQTVFYSLREGDALLAASDVATPLLQVDDANGSTDRPLYAAAIASVGAGWAIFCPNTLDSERGDGAAFGQALRSFVPDENGARWVGLPLRILGTDASPASIQAILASRLGAALHSDGRAALPNFGTAPAIAPVAIETGSEPVLPLDLDEARGIFNALSSPIAAPETALLVARMQWQLGQNNRSAQSLKRAALAPVLAPQVAFLNGCFAAQSAGDVSLDAPSRAVFANAAARAFSALGGANGLVRGAAQGANNAVALAPLSLSPSLAARWSRDFARLAAIYTLAPPFSQFIAGNGASATLRFYTADSNALPVATLLQSALQSAGLGARAPHVEVMLLPSPADYAGVRRALNAPVGQTLPGGEVIGQTILLASGGNNEFGLTGNGANAATLARGLALANLNSWSEGARPLPAWVVAGTQGRVLGVRPQLAASDSQNLGAALRGTSPASPALSTALWNFLLDQYGTGAGEELVARLAAGASVEQGLQGATGDGASAFEDAFVRAAG